MPPQHRELGSRVVEVGDDLQHAARRAARHARARCRSARPRRRSASASAGRRWCGGSACARWRSRARRPRTRACASAAIACDVVRAWPARGSRRARPSRRRAAPRAAAGCRVDVEAALPRGVEVVREALPVPRQALGQHRERDVLDAFHQPDQPVVVVAAGRARSRRRSCPSPRWSRRATTTAACARPRWPGRRSGCGCRRSPGVTSLPLRVDLLARPNR